MDLTLSSEQESIREAVRGVLGARLSARRAQGGVAAERGLDLALWREAAALGWLGLALPEAAGGAGYGLPEEVILFVELGRSLAPGPVAAEALGIAERTLEGSVAYAKTRHQFGRPIGAFQAVKHRCADMAVRAEVARSIVTFAAVALRDAEPEAPRHVHEAKVLATSAALAN